VFQPIVDLAGATVAGYQALARFPGAAGPDVWFAAAAEARIAAQLLGRRRGRHLQPGRRPRGRRPRRHRHHPELVQAVRDRIQSI
jgi:EAL domain-containing protein (putative c-di-GMP-specific phosphodiesterase class I)